MSFALHSRKPLCVMFGTQPSPSGLGPPANRCGDDAAKKIARAVALRAMAETVDEIGAAIPLRPTFAPSGTNGLPSRNRNFQTPTFRRTLNGKGTSWSRTWPGTGGSVFR